MKKVAIATALLLARWGATVIAVKKIAILWLYTRLKNDLTDVIQSFYVFVSTPRVTSNSTYTVSILANDIKHFAIRWWRISKSN